MRRVRGSDRWALKSTVEWGRCEIVDRSGSGSRTGSGKIYDGRWAM